MSACMMAKFGSGIALGGAAIASVDPATATGFVNQHGVVGVLVVIALVLWAKSERQEKKADEYRENRRLEEKARDEKLNGTLGGLAEAIRAMHKHCEDRTR
jgi:hypothetical protein